MAFLARLAAAAVALNYSATPTSYLKDAGMLAVPHNNERVELAMQILECRRKLRQAGHDDEAKRSETRWSG